MGDANELLEEVQKGYTGDAFDDLHAECKAGNLPDEYLRALAKRARKRAISPDISPESAWIDMALKLEAWAGE